MPLCYYCKQELSDIYFSKSQIKKNVLSGKLKCKNCCKLNVQEEIEVEANQEIVEPEVFKTAE